MKKFYILIILFLGYTTVRSQEPASIRTGKITASWQDRANVTSGGKKPAGSNLLWYQQPASVWEESLPLGNGNLNAMVFGGIADKRIQLNESSL